MRTLRAVVIVGLVAKLLVLGAWWRTASAVRSAEVASEARPTAGEARPATAGAEPRAATALAAEAGVPADLFTRSRGFRDVLEAVQQRGAALDEREQALVSREATLKALEKTLADEITRIEALTKPAAAKPAAGADAAASAPGPGSGPALTKIYETMKPEEAGPILDKLDDPTLVAILGRMKERNLGSILAAMNRDRAVAVTKALAAGEGSAGR